MWIRLEQHDPRDKNAALALLARDYQNEHEFLTGLMYLDSSRETLQDDMDLTGQPLCTLPQEVVRPSREALAEINESLR